MAVSTPFGKSVQLQYLDNESPSEEKNSGCVLANLISQSLSMYVELEKTHWHLRLNSAGAAVNGDPAGPTEIAGEVCTIALRLIASISRLQRVLQPNFNPECAALFAAVEEKIAEIRELPSERQFNSFEQLEPIVFQGLGTFRDIRLPENAKSVPAGHLEM